MCVCVCVPLISVGYGTLTGFLLFVYMTSIIFTLTNMIVFFSGVGALAPAFRFVGQWDPFLEEDPATHFAVLSTFSRGQSCENLDTQDKGDSLTTATGKLFKDMTATCHPPSIAGEIAGRSSNTLWAFQQTHHGRDSHQVFRASPCLFHRSHLYLLS